MCGIAGLYQREGRVDLGRLHHMGQLLRHRGPHDESMVLIDPRGDATYTAGGPDTPAEVFASGLRWAPGRHDGDATHATFGLGFVHRRLSIVDLSPTGHQPMCDPPGRTWIVYNGEVYNHVELRHELAAAGERFLGTSDTEVILAAYRRWGIDCLSHFNGMFAFALWDGETRRLFAARDRLGVKPFYYQWDGRTLAFASEPRALVLTQSHRVVPNLDAVRDLVALDWVDHDTTTFFEGVHQLPAGHHLITGPDGFAVRRWWTIDPDRHATGTAADWEAEFRDTFTDAVRIRLRADVEVGACLSGGTDSSAVVTTASRLMDRPIHAFTCAYDEGPAFDERPYVRAAVETSGAVSHVVVPDGGDFWEVFDALARSEAEPTAGPGVYSQWKVMDLAHQAGLRVLLDGQGGDEILAGYFRYLPLRLRDLVARGDLGAAWRLFGPVSARLGGTHTLALAFEPWLPRPLVARLRRAFGQGKDTVLGPALLDLARATPPVPPSGFDTAVRRQQAFDTLQRLLPSLLRYEDRNSMAFSIETRLPFLDYRVVELAFSLPDEQKLDGVVTKAIMRRALADRIPQRVLDRRDKMGFETPADVWLRGRYAAETRRRLLGGGVLREWLDPRTIAGRLDEYLAGRREIGLQVWRWLSLESWARQYVERDPRIVPVPEPVYLHPGLHLDYRQVTERLQRETSAAGVG
ncbi:MAG: asparagine synthase (glutamine-hydrolyzing) [Candidatus Eisenbacteria bacterium]